MVKGVDHCLDLQSTTEMIFHSDSSVPLFMSEICSLHCVHVTSGYCTLYICRHSPSYITYCVMLHGEVKVPLYTVLITLSYGCTLNITSAVYEIYSNVQHAQFRYRQYYSACDISI